MAVVKTVSAEIAFSRMVHVLFVQVVDQPDVLYGMTRHLLELFSGGEIFSVFLNWAVGLCVQRPAKAGA
ncbi:hypothetical protein [Roseovarius phycicola]|uniref:hypothetical protein n=1 Tax=Roseovarius phycicola TaxID=3080976 RepID=UPI0030CFCBF5